MTNSSICVLVIGKEDGIQIEIIIIGFHAVIYVKTAYGSTNKSFGIKVVNYVTPSLYVMVKLFFKICEIMCSEKTLLRIN